MSLALPRSSLACSSSPPMRESQLRCVFVECSHHFPLPASSSHSTDCWSPQSLLYFLHLCLCSYCPIHRECSSALSPVSPKPNSLLSFEVSFQSGLWHVELCSLLCGRLNGRVVWGRMDACVCMAESLYYSPEATTTS